MEDLEKIFGLLSDARRTSKDIIRKSLISMKKLKEGDPQILEEIRKKKQGVPMPTIKKMAEAASLEMIKDAETVNEEIDAFARAIANNKNVDDCGSEFMLQVWNGDAYDETGINALTELVNDLKAQYKKCGSSRIIELATA